jgi:hypothetical protein
LVIEAKDERTLLIILTPFLVSPQSISLLDTQNVEAGFRQATDFPAIDAAPLSFSQSGGMLALP